MKNDKTLYNLIYDAILSDIYNGRYPYQSQLPSLLELCDIYQAGRNTIRSVIIMLQENNYVHIVKGTRAKVIFNIHDFEVNTAFLQTILNRRQMSGEIFLTLEWIMPSIVLKSLRRASKQQIETLNNKVKQLKSDEKVENVEQIMSYLMDIYLYALSFLNNPLLCDMFSTMMHSVVMPTTSSLTKDLLKEQIRFIKPILSNAISFAIKGNDFMVKKLIGAFTSMYRLQILRYIDRICEGMTPTQNTRMLWVSRREQEFLYEQVVVDILKNIDSGIYKHGDLLPSMAELAKKYNVSVRTSRKAIAKLNELGVVQTKNGIGSKVNKFSGCKDTIRCSKTVGENIKHYCYAQNLIGLLLEGVALKVLTKLDRKEIIEFIQNLKKEDNNVYSYTYDFIFSHTNECLRDIYAELGKPIIWNVYVKLTLDMKEINENMMSARYELISLLENKKYRKAANVIINLANVAEVITQEFYERKLIIVEESDE